MWGLGVGTLLERLDGLFESRVPMPLTSRQHYAASRRVYENSGMGVRIRSEWVYGNGRSAHSSAFLRITVCYRALPDGLFGPARIAWRGAITR